MTNLPPSVLNPANQKHQKEAPCFICELRFDADSFMIFHLFPIQIVIIYAPDLFALSSIGKVASLIHLFSIHNLDFNLLAYSSFHRALFVQLYAVFYHLALYLHSSTLAC